jgi:hypothetical protein
VTEYLRELAAIEDIRVNAAADENKNDPTSMFTEAIHTGTLMQLELNSQINVLKQMRLDDPFNRLIPGIIELRRNGPAHKGSNRWSNPTLRPLRWHGRRILTASRYKECQGREVENSLPKLVSRWGPSVPHLYNKAF